MSESNYKTHILHTYPSLKLVMYTGVLFTNFYSYLENNDLTWDTFTYSSIFRFFIVLMLWTACSALILLLLASPSRNILSSTAFCLLEKRKLFLFGTAKPSSILMLDGRTSEVDKDYGVLDWTGLNIVLASWMLELILFMKQFWQHQMRTYLWAVHVPQKACAAPAPLWIHTL